MQTNQSINRRFQGHYKLRRFLRVFCLLLLRLKMLPIKALKNLSLILHLKEFFYVCTRTTGCFEVFGVLRKCILSTLTMHLKLALLHSSHSNCTGFEATHRSIRLVVLTSTRVHSQNYIATTSSSSDIKITSGSPFTS